MAAYGVDERELAATLRAIADGLESGDAEFRWGEYLIEGVATGEITQTLELEFRSDKRFDPFQEDVGPTVVRD